MFCYVLLACNVFCKAHSLSLDSIQCYISEVCLRTPIELNLVDFPTAFTANINCSSFKIPLGNKVIWEISYEICISWCFDPIQLNMNSWLILFFHERVFNLYLWNCIHYSVVCKSYSLFSIKTYQIPFQYSILCIEVTLHYIHILIWLSLTIQPIFPRDLLELWIVISF